MDCRKNLRIFSLKLKVMKNIHVLPTDKPSRLFEILQFNFVFDNQNMYSTEYKKLHKYKNKHIYITNDEEIKDGDWFLDDNNQISRSYRLSHVQFANPKKIILTTDQDLIKDGVQAIEDNFLEWFVKNPSCEEIEFYNWISFSKNMRYYEPIIQKEESKQETLEEVDKRLWTEVFTQLFPNWNNGDVLEQREQAEIKAFIQGAKWQQERMYSEEELFNFADFYHKYKELIKAEKWEIIEMSKEEVLKKWFEQFKNK